MHASDNSQATILCMHARSAAAARNENLKSRKTRARLAGDDKTQRRAKAHAHPASASPSLVFPQPRPAAAAAHRRRHLPRPPRTDGGTAARSTYTQPLPKVLLDFRLVFSFSKFSVSHSNFDASCPAQPALAKFLWRVVRIPERGTHAQSPLVVRS